MVSDAPGFLVNMDFFATCKRGSRATLAMLNVLALANLHQQQKKGIDIAPSMHQLHYQNSPPCYASISKSMVTGVDGDIIALYLSHKIQVE